MGISKHEKNSMPSQPHFIAWMFWNATGGPSQRWSRDHIIDDAEDKTLCGRRVPGAAFSYMRGQAYNLCFHCLKRWEKDVREGKRTATETFLRP